MSTSLRPSRSRRGDRDLDRLLESRVLDSLSFVAEIAAELETGKVATKGPTFELLVVVDEELVLIVAGVGSLQLLLLAKVRRSTLASSRYDLSPNLLKKTETNCWVSFCKNTSSWSRQIDLSSSSGLSFLISAITYLARASGSASQLPLGKKDNRQASVFRTYSKSFPTMASNTSTYSGSKYEVNHVLSRSPSSMIMADV